MISSENPGAESTPSTAGSNAPADGRVAENTVVKRKLPESVQKGTHVETSPQGRYLRFEEKLGSGQYKDVYRAYDTWEGIEVAWNTVNMKMLPKEDRKRIMNEVRLLQNLEHKNLVQFHGSWVNREKEQVVFVTEIVVNGSLKDFINKVELIRWKVVKRWVRQILRGLTYLHSKIPPIIHRDLKCDNIFINGHTGDIRIGDLGLSTSSTRTDKTMSVLGTPEFMAPELYDESYNEKVDIYAFGMCVLEMITKQRPYSECNNAAQIYKRVVARVLPSVLDRIQPRQAADIIRLCLQFDPNERPTAEQLLAHPFLSEKSEECDNEEVGLLPVPMLGDGEGGGSGFGSGSLGWLADSPLPLPSLAEEDNLTEMPSLEGAAGGGLPDHMSDRSSGRSRRNSATSPIHIGAGEGIEGFMEGPTISREVSIGHLQAEDDDQDDHEHEHLLASMPNAETQMRNILLPEGRADRESDYNENDPTTQPEKPLQSPTPYPGLQNQNHLASNNIQQQQQQGVNNTVQSSQGGGQLQPKFSKQGQQPKRLDSIGSGGVGVGGSSAVGQGGGPMATVLEESSSQTSLDTPTSTSVGTHIHTHTHSTKAVDIVPNFLHPPSYSAGRMTWMSTEGTEHSSGGGEESEAGALHLSHFISGPASYGGQSALADLSYPHLQRTTSTPMEETEPLEQMCTIKEARSQGTERDVMRLVMHTLVKGRLQEVEFDFNLEHDAADAVAAEMIKELDLPDHELGQIGDTITSLAERSRKRRLKRTPSNTTLNPSLGHSGVYSSTGSTSAFNSVTGGLNLGLGLANGMSTLQGGGSVHEMALSALDDSVSGGVGAKANNEPPVSEIPFPHTLSDRSLGAWNSREEPPPDQPDKFLEAVASAAATVASSTGGGGDGSQSDSDLERDGEHARNREGFLKKLRLAKIAYQSRHANLSNAYNECMEEHRRQQEKFRKDCEEFDRKKIKMEQEFNIRVEEIQREWAELEGKLRKSRLEARKGGTPSESTQGTAGDVAELELLFPVELGIGERSSNRELSSLSDTASSLAQQQIFQSAPGMSTSNKEPGSVVK